VYRIYFFFIIFELFLSFAQVYYVYITCVLFLCLPLSFSPVVNIKNVFHVLCCKLLLFLLLAFSSLFHIISMASLIFHSISVVRVQHIFLYYIVQTECAVIINNTWNHVLIKHLCWQVKSLRTPNTHYKSLIFYMLHLSIDNYSNLASKNSGAKKENGPKA
jgi:hypothetical protein